MPYGSVGAAFTGGVEDFMAQKFAQDLALKREAREQKIAEDEHNERVAALEEKRQEARERMRERERGEVEKTVANMEPGDIPDANLQDQARKHHVPIRLIPPKPVQPAAPEGIASMDAPKGPESIPEGTGVLKSQPQQQVYAGNMKQRQEVDKQQKIVDLEQRIRTSKPGTDDYQQALVEYEIAKSGQIPAGAFKQPGTTMEKVMTREQALALGQVPAGTKIIEPLQPKDNSAKENREAQLFNTAHQQAVKEWEDLAKPVKGHLDSATELTQMLRMKTPVTDKLVAPLTLKAIISGQGSGFRMTRAEIDNVTHGRSRWDDLNVAINKWSANPTEALDLSDVQREDLANLAREVRNRAQKSFEKLTKARHALDDAANPKALYQTMTGLNEEMAVQDEAPTTTPTMSAADLIKKYGGKQ